MKYYKSQNQPYPCAFEDDYDGDCITEDMALMTPEEIDSHLNSVPDFARRKINRLAQFREERTASLNVISGIGLAALMNQDSATAQAMSIFRRGLLDLPQHPSIDAAVDIDSLDIAIQSRYGQLIDALPESLRSDFYFPKG